MKRLAQRLHLFFQPPVRERKPLDIQERTIEYRYIPTKRCFNESAHKH